MQFLEKEELPHFKFQKDFLMPFREVLANNPDVTIKDMVRNKLPLQLGQISDPQYATGFALLVTNDTGKSTPHPIRMEDYAVSVCYRRERNIR